MELGMISCSFACHQKRAHSFRVLVHIKLIQKLFYSICDWLWENPPVTHKDNYLEKRNRIIQSVISPEGLKLQACNLQHSYSYSRSIRLSYLQCIASWIFRHFRQFYYQHHKHLYRGGGWGVVGSHKVAGYSGALHFSR